MKHTVLSSVFGSQQPGDTLGSAMLHNSQTKILVVERRKKSMKNNRKIRIQTLVFYLLLFFIEARQAGNTR